MKLVNLTHNEDYVRFSKNMTIKVNDLITVDASICGGVCYIDSKLFGKVVVLEDPDTTPTYYIGGKKTKYNGFKELYNQLFNEDYNVLLCSIERFAENAVLDTFDNPIKDLTTKQKIKLLREQVDLMPRFESDCGKIIAYRQWAVNEVLYTLDIPNPSSKKYYRLYEGSASYGVDLSVYENILKELSNKSRKIFDEI